MTAALESLIHQSTVLDIRSYEATAPTSPASSLRTTPIVRLPFRPSADANSTHAALSAYITSYGFLCLLLFTFLNMRMLSSPSLATAAGERLEPIIVFCCYSLCLMFVLLFFAYYFYRVMSGTMLRAKSVRDSDRVLVDAEWLQAQQTQHRQYELSRAVSVWSMVRSDPSVRSVLTVLLSLNYCLVFVWYGTRLSAVDLLVLALVSVALLIAAAAADELLAFLTAFALSDGLRPLITALVGCPAPYILSDGMLLATSQLVLCTVLYIAARVCTRPVALLLFSSTLHSRLLLVQPIDGALLTLLGCSLCSLTLHRMASQQSQSSELARAAADDSEDADDADISEELWRVRQFVCTAAVYALASNGWRCVHCLLGDELVPNVISLAALLMLGVREYKLRERHKQV